MTILNKCCFCLELEVGVAVIGWLGAILCPLNIITVIIALSSGHPITFDVVLQLITLVLHFGVAICLIRATQCKNKRLLLPWLIIAVVGLVFVNIIFINLVIHVKEAAPFIVSLLLSNAIGVYFWLCVYSYYQELDALV